jgi:hypothetical protein
MFELTRSFDHPIFRRIRPAVSSDLDRRDTLRLCADPAPLAGHDFLTALREHEIDKQRGGVGWGGRAAIQKP